MSYIGKLHIKRYIPKKKSCFVLRIFILASPSPELRDYTFDFILDYGKENSIYLYKIKHTFLAQ